MKVRVMKDGVELSSGTQFIYVRGELYPIDTQAQEEGTPIKFTRNLLDKQISQYAYTNENPVSILAQEITSPSDPKILLMSGTRNSIETKVFIGPRGSQNYSRMILYTEDNEVSAEFYTDSTDREFDSLLNDDKSKFVSIVYSRAYEGNSYELDLHTDATTYPNATKYSSLNYLNTNNFPHFNQLKYSNRVVSNDDFITSSMGINSTIKYTPHFGNYYIRPDFVKAFKGFKIIGKTDPTLELTSSSNILADDGTTVSSVNIEATCNAHYSDLFWDYSPKIPGIELTVTSNSTATLSYDPKIVHNYDLFTSQVTVTVTCAQRMVDSIVISIAPYDASAADSATIYVADPAKDPNPWYNVTDYLTLKDDFRMRADEYTMSTSSGYIELDPSNYRFRIKGDYSLFSGGTITWTYTPHGSEQSYSTTININKAYEPGIVPPVYPIYRDSFTIHSRFKVLEWIQCKESELDIKDLTDYTCKIDSDEGLLSVKAKTLHGTYLLKEVLSAST